MKQAPHLSGFQRYSTRVAVHEWGSVCYVYICLKASLACREPNGSSCNPDATCRVGPMLAILLTAVAGSLLHEAVEKNDAVRIAQALNTSKNEQRRMLETLDENDIMPIHSAAYHGHTEAMVALVKGGAPLNARAHGDMTALHWATGQGHDDILKLLIEAGADVEARDGGGRTALHFASARGHVESLRALVEANVSLEVLSARNVTALQMASEQGFADAVRVLAAAGARLEAQADEMKLAALHAAAAMGHVDVVQVLLGAGAAVEVRDARLPVREDLSATQRRATSRDDSPSRLG